MWAMFQLEKEKLVSARKNGLKVVGYFCPNFPEELILAAGIHPLRLEDGEKHPDIDGACLIDKCTGMEKPELKPGTPVFTLNLPPSDRFRRDYAARESLDKELRGIRVALGRLSGRPITYFDDLRAMTLCGRIRRLLKHLFEFPADNRSPLEWEQAFEMRRLGGVMDRRAFLEELVEIEKALRLRTKSKEAASSKIRLMITGASLCGIEKLNEILSQAGGVIVADYACTGSMLLRKTTPVFGVTERIIESASERSIYNAPCVSRGDIRGRLDRMVRIARNYRVQGLLYYNPGDNEAIRQDFKIIDKAFYQELAVPAFLVNGSELESELFAARLKDYFDIIGGRV